MSDVEAAIQALKAAQAEPNMDPITYLTLIESHLSSEILPALNDILQDPKLTQEIGWDLIDMLVKFESSDKCLETIARLGNPREAILKVLEVLERSSCKDAYETSPYADSQFITLLGMLAILHKRIKTKYPSRFLYTSLATIVQVYNPTPRQTAAVVNLVRSLSRKSRPPLPIRRSSTFVKNPERDGDPSRNAPDPEAEAEDPTEKAIQEKLILSFTTCILEVYVQANNLEWSARLLETYSPQKRIPGSKTRLEAFKDDEELLNRDTMVGQLAALVRDLGLSKFTPELIKSLCNGPIVESPLSQLNIDEMSPDSIPLSTGGTICLLAYKIFSSTVFGADHSMPEMNIFPEHFMLMEGYMGDDFGKRANNTPGTVDALVAIAQWLKHEDRVSSMGKNNQYMEYLHFLGLTAVFHPQILVRNATTSLAGSILHYNPDDEDRLKVLEDLIENCMFDALRASAISWLREEIINAHNTDTPSVFMSSECIDQLQYHLFPNESLMAERSPQANWQTWQSNRLFYHQVVNLAYFLFSGEQYKHLVPAGMGSTVQERFLDPLEDACEGILKALKTGELGTELEVGPNEKMDLEILVDVARTVSKLLDKNGVEAMTEKGKEKS